MRTRKERKRRKLRARIALGIIAALAITAMAIYAINLLLGIGITIGLTAIFVGLMWLIGTAIAG